jgi:predicted transcriptional regulator
MPTSVLLSIKPSFANAILEGTKTFELRRTVFRNRTVRKIVMYASSPVSLVVGEFIVDGILAFEPKELWALTAKGAGVDQAFFDDYFRGREIGFALKVHHPRRYAKPLRLQEHFGLSRPPQSFCYLAQNFMPNNLASYTPENKI